MDKEVKNALELIKSTLSRAEQIKALFSNKDGNIDLRYLKLKGFNVLLTGLEAEFILNARQKAKRISNNRQQARYISNNDQTIIKTPKEVFDSLTPYQQEELIKKL